MAFKTPVTISTIVGLMALKTPAPITTIVGFQAPVNLTPRFTPFCKSQFWYQNYDGSFARNSLSLQYETLADLQTYGDLQRSVNLPDLQTYTPSIGCKS